VELSVRDLPTLNAALNATCALLLLAGYVMIRRGARVAHRRCMSGALLISAAFLVSYLVYHFQVGSVRYQGTGGVRALYLGILLTHTVLAMVNVPLVLWTLSRALRQRFDAHRRIARLTLPIWGYVSVTGVVIYLMLYGA
jgi:uncharacterized membrane protein YozB (DUF420 family)